ncbi:PLP-dependent aminotransferase family protein [Vibrio sp. DW001]|uniref:aminotransferase-like domain-containing protein n=1 Tax=Vibrio sp. DW001 TaxID=2912315 RepID=UPI0023B06BFB|nr:PLP-dependent aminotransferase family protein [Vibrio sp. DW001]WED29583.1 PLP-dependent aminotransferase family protein [Vibrio sp. DW001]
MAEDIASEMLTKGTQLPPHRILAYKLGISPNTTSRAYKEAVKRALIQGEVGRGTFVRSINENLPVGALADLNREVKGPIDLSRNLPMPGFADTDIKRILKDISYSGNVSALLDYQTKDDLSTHKEAGKIWLTGCGIDANTDQIIPTMGGQHGILCALMALLQPGDLLLTEALTYIPVIAIAERLGLYTATVAMDDGGVIPESFEQLCIQAKPKAFYLTPTLQAPTTVTLSLHRRKEIAEIAEKYNVILIEDDVFAPLKRNRAVPIALLAPEHTVYITSLSKTVAPGLRVGFLYFPSRFSLALSHTVNLSIWMTPPLTMEIAARLINDGTAKTLSIKQSAAAEERQTLARSILTGLDFMADPQGFHIWIPLPDQFRADHFCMECAKYGVLVNNGRCFAPNVADAPEAIRICLSHEVDKIRVARGLNILAKLIQKPPSISAFEI